MSQTIKALQRGSIFLLMASQSRKCVKQIESLMEENCRLIPENKSLKKKIDQLKEQIDQLKEKLSKQIQQSQEQSRENQQQKSQIIHLHNYQIKSMNQQIDQLKEKNCKLTELRNNQSREKQLLDCQIKDLFCKVKELKVSLDQKKQECIKADQLASRILKVIQNVSSALEKKLGRKMPKPEDFAKEIINYNPPIGKKLVTSHILNGYDQQRSQIITTIEKFTKKQISRTDLSARHPEIKTILHAFPKGQTQFAFVILYKTKQGTILGSFSEGMRKATFIFSFPIQEGIEQNKLSDVKFFIPQNCNKNNSIYLSESRYLQYGSGELKLNCLEPSTITVNSEIGNQNYYSLNWKEVMNEYKEDKVSLSELELHKVEFEQ